MTLTALLTAFLVAPQPEPGTPRGGFVFAEIDGVVSIEAEHFTRNKGYRFRTDKDGFSGLGFMATERAGQKLEYTILFRTPGRYYLHLRAWADDHVNNGFHAQFDGKSISGDGIYVKKYSRWDWYTKEHDGPDEAISFVVPSPGRHRFSITRREPESWLDKILIHDGQFGKGPIPAFPDGPGPTETRSGSYGTLVAKDVVHLKKVAAHLRRGKPGLALQEAEKELSTEDAEASSEARRVVEAIRAYAQERKARIDAIKMKSPRIALDRLERLGNELSPAGLGQELLAEKKRWLDDPGFQKELEAWKILDPARRAAEGIRETGKADDPRFARRYAAELQAIRQAALKLRKEYPATASFREADALARRLGIPLP